MAKRYLDSNGLAYLWSKIKSMFVSHSELENVEQDLESYILLPNFDNLTPISTIELDTASTSYYQIFTRENTNISSDMSDVNDIVLFRITTTGTGIYAVDDFIVRFQNGLTYPQVVGTANTLSVSAATTGLYYIRFNYPKTLNSGYPWVCDLRTYNATARHIKIEVFSTTDKVTWMDSLTATTFSTTYQTESSILLYDRRGVVHNGTFYGNAYSANSASYETYYHARYFNSSIVKAGETLAANYILYVNNGYAYRVSNTDNSIDPEFGINICTSSYAAGSFISTAPYFAQQKATVPISADANTTYDSINVGDKVYLRCRLVGDKIYSDGHLSTSMSAGYTWYLIGAAYSTTNISFSTIGSMFITLDEYGMISHINGKPTQSSLYSGGYERRFCGEIISNITSSARIRLAEGRSLVFNQIVNNGDFSNSTTGWTITGSASISDDVLSVYSATGGWGVGAYTTTSGVNSNAPIKNGHKYFYSVYAKASRVMNCYAPFFNTSSPVPTRQQGATAPNQLTTEWQRFTGVILATGDTYAAFGVRNYTALNSQVTVYIKAPFMIDLTKMFGAGNEPQDMEMLKQMFPLDYYDYNANGTLISGIQTGFKSEDSEGNTLTNLAIPLTSITGKVSGSGSSVVMFPNGLNGIGNVRDEIDFDNEIAIKRIEKRNYQSGDENLTNVLTDGTNTAYLLDNPVEYVMDAMHDTSYNVEVGGNEKWLPVNGTTPTTAPICSISVYGRDIFVDLNRKADKVINATSGNFAGLDATGNLTDSGYNADDFTNFVLLNGYSGIYGIHQKSLAAFAVFSGGMEMKMMSFTQTGGTGSKSVISGFSFPIGCKIYYHDEATVFAPSTSFTSKKFFSSYKNVDGRYSAITGTDIRLGDTVESSVYLRVNVAFGYWSPYYEQGETDEIIVTSDQFENDNFYIYLGKTSSTNTYSFQLEDNNPLYFYDGKSLIDWATITSDNVLNQISAALGNFVTIGTNQSVTGRKLFGLYGDQYHIYNVCNFRRTSTFKHVAIYTNIPYNSSVMPVVSINGFMYERYNLGLKLTFSFYSGEFYYPRVQNTGTTNIDVYLFSYSDNGTDKVAIGLAANFYYAGFQSEVHFPTVGETYIPTSQWTTEYDDVVYDENTPEGEKIIPTIGVRHCVKAGKNKLYDIPVNVSQLENDSNYVTPSTTSLVNYFTKVDTYSKSEVDSIVDDISNFTYEVVDVLPVASALSMGVMYICNGHRYVTTLKESLYQWTDLGSYDIDLTDYVTETELETALEHRPEHQEVTEREIEEMIEHETWEQGVIYYTVEED